VLVVTRYRVEPALASDFVARAKVALAALAERPGWRSGRIGRATDDAGLWLLSTEWDSVGAYRRALSAYQVKVDAVPLLSLAVDEPTAYEVVEAAGQGSVGLAAPSGLAADAGLTRLGEAAAAHVPTGLE
jgi:hypothetical protein